MFVAPNWETLEATAGVIEKLGKKVIVVEANLAEIEISPPSRIVDESPAHFARIDALLNLAGAVPQIDLSEMTDEQRNTGFALKLHGGCRLTIVVWPAVKESKGSVVLISGNSAQFPKATYAAVGTIDASIMALYDRSIEDRVQANSLLPDR